MAQPTCVIGVDIGGTKINAGAVVLEPTESPRQILAAQHVATPRLPPPSFYDAVAAVVRRVQAGLREQGIHPAPILAVAHPGRFLPDGTLARATTPNLGTAPGQFDGIAPARELACRLGVEVVAENDAVAQMRFGLDRLLRDPAIRLRLLGQTVVYLGPGTGMGGGVARISPAGQVTPVTDGHLFDLQVPAIGDGTLTAEELFTGPAIARAVEQANRALAVPIVPARGGQLDVVLTSPDAPEAHRRVAEEIADRQGEILAAMIETIHAGRIRKVRLETATDGRLLRHMDEPDRAWSGADQRLVRGARRCVLGGFIGTSLGLGGRIRQRGLERLAAHGLSGVEIFQIPLDSADAGVLGAVRAIPQRCQTPFKAGKVSDTS